LLPTLARTPNAGRGSRQAARTAAGNLSLFAKSRLTCHICSLLRELPNPGFPRQPDAVRDFPVSDTRRIVGNAFTLET